MKILLLTVAGMSSRFSRSLKKECLKCIYYENSIEESLLYRMLHQQLYFDRILIVGGYRFQELQTVIHNDFSDFSDRLTLLYNEKYSSYGSGYSLYIGLKSILNIDFDELIFAEGDLYVVH